MKYDGFGCSLAVFCGTLFYKPSVSLFIVFLAVPAYSTVLLSPYCQPRACFFGASVLVPGPRFEVESVEGGCPNEVHPKLCYVCMFFILYSCYVMYKCCPGENDSWIYAPVSKSNDFEEISHDWSIEVHDFQVGSIYSVTVY